MTDQHGKARDDRSTTDKVKEKAQEAKHRTEAAAETVASEASERGRQAVEEGREKARDLGEDAARMAQTRAEEQKARLAGGMRSMARALRTGTRELRPDQRSYSRVLETVADGVDGVSTYMEEHDVDGITRDARRFARDHAALFVGGAFALGVAGARFLKSSEPEPSGPREVGPARAVREPGLAGEEPLAGREPAPPYPRTESPRQASERIQEEGGYA